MVERNADFAVQAMAGTLAAGDGDRLWRGCVLDSRRIDGDEIFFALPGEQVDGHRFASMAAEKGAGAVVVHDASVIPEASDNAAWILVNDTYKALHDLTRAVRREVPKKLVALTGSVGKTTTKEILGHVLEQHFGAGRVARSLGNFNNLYGFPIALLGIDNTSEWMVAEMGMSTPGELGGVSRLGKPDAVLLLCVRAVHLENFGTLRGIANAKAEILEGLADNGLIVANANDPEVMAMVERHRATGWDGRLVTFGIENAEADVWSTPAEPAGLGSRFTVTYEGEESSGETVNAELPLYGLYNAENALAATATAVALGMPLAAAANALAGLRPPPGRGNVHELGGNVTLVDDSYNSNPDAAVKALESARLLTGKRHIAVLGSMLELGPEAPEMHREVGRRAAELGFSRIAAVGEIAASVADGARVAGVDAVHLANAADAGAWLRDQTQDDDVVLIKGSRGVGLEAAVRALHLARGPKEVGD